MGGILSPARKTEGVVMIRLIVNILFLIVLAVFIALNVSYSTSVNIFGRVFENISVVAVILLSIVLGVLYSFLFYVSTYLGKLQKGKIKEKKDFTKKKEKELKTREKLLEKSSPAQVVMEEENPLSLEEVRSKRGRKKKNQE